MTTGNSRTLPDEAESLLTELWRQVLARDARGVTRHEIAEFTRPVCAIARAAGLLPEELIVAVKKSWNSHHDPRSSTVSRRLDEALSDFISSCIEEFYRPSSGGKRDPSVGWDASPG